MFKVQDHILYQDGEPVDQRPSPNHGGEIDPTLVVIHYTADNSLEGALSWLTSAKSQVSAHLVIAKDGTVHQLLPFNVEGWHARGHYNGLSVNSNAIGIENVGVGDDWPDAQVEAIRQVLTAISAAYTINDIFGHMDIPDRTPGHDDPGPNFPWERVTA